MQWKNRVLQQCLQELYRSPWIQNHPPRTCLRSSLGRSLQDGSTSKEPMIHSALTLSKATTSQRGRGNHCQEVRYSYHHNREHHHSTHRHHHCPASFRHARTSSNARPVPSRSIPKTSRQDLRAVSTHHSPVGPAGDSGSKARCLMFGPLKLRVRSAGRSLINTMLRNWLRLKSMRGGFMSSSYVSQLTLSRYLDAELKALLSTDENFVWCLSPTCSSGQVHDGGDIFTCSSCGFRQCVECKTAWHAGQRCGQVQSQGQPQGPQARRRLREESSTMDLLEAESKLCPGEGCNRRVQKIG